MDKKPLRMPFTDGENDRARKPIPQHQLLVDAGFNCRHFLIDPDANTISEETVGR